MYIEDKYFDSVVASTVSVIERMSKKEDATAEEVQALAAVVVALRQFVDFRR